MAIVDTRRHTWALALAGFLSLSGCKNTDDSEAAPDASDGAPDGVVLDAAGDGALQATPDAGDSEAGPGGVETPEQILAHPRVQAALTAARERGFPVATRTERGAPKIAGYYSKEAGTGSYVASGNGANVGSGFFGFEMRVKVDASDRVEEASVSFYNGDAVGSVIKRGAILRGVANEFTLYTQSQRRCPDAASNFTVQGVTITSAEFEATTGDWVSVRTLDVTIATEGQLSAACAQMLAGDTETVGGWALGEVPRYEHITPADLTYMCVDEDVGYVAGESWMRADRSPCRCSDSFSVVCR
jgi:hypothetical protein